MILGVSYVQLLIGKKRLRFELVNIKQLVFILKFVFKFCCGNINGLDIVFKLMLLLLLEKVFKIKRIECFLGFFMLVVKIIILRYQFFGYFLRGIENVFVSRIKGLRSSDNQQVLMGRKIFLFFYYVKSYLIVFMDICIVLFFYCQL